jgi:hypothetical protein
MQRSLNFLNDFERLTPTKGTVYGRNYDGDKRGRKVDPNSERQKKIADRLKRLADGEIIKRGRPSGKANMAVKVNLNDILKDLSI